MHTSTRITTKMVHFLWSAVLLLWSVPLTASLSVTPLFQLTTSRIVTGTVAMSTAAVYGNTSANSLGFTTYMVPFSSTITAPSSAVTSMTSIRYEMGESYDFNITTFACNFYSSSLKICVVSNSLSQLNSLACRYLAINDPQNKIYHLYYSAIHYIQNYNSVDYDVYNPMVADFGVAPGINTTGTLRAFALFNGFNATSDSSYLFQITITASYTPSTAFEVFSTSGSTTAIQMKALVYTLIGYNEEESQSWPFPAIRVTYGSFSPSSPFVSNLSILQSYNTFWGLTELKISSDNFLEFDSDMTAQTSVWASTTNSEPTFSWMAFLFQFKQCPPEAPYYLIAQDLCYDICPSRYYESNLKMTCQLCTSYDCLKCLSNGTCTTCDNTTDFRQLNSYGRCQPIDGYYESYVTVALPCDSCCRTCSAGTSSDCTACYDGYYLSGGSCISCVSNCTLCSSASNCSACNTNYILNSQLCLLQCDVFVTNCSTCEVPAESSTVVCLTCEVGFSLISASNQCLIICGDGILATNEGCDDGNLINGDGCDSTCQVETSYYCQGTLGNTSVCQPCSPFCLLCTNGSVCNQCQPVYSLVNGSCFLDCTVITGCVSCHVDSAPRLLCDSCGVGYGPTQNKDGCVPICGDGYLVAGQGCEDGNTVSGDGCDDKCQVEQYFTCSPLPNTNLSECYLSQLSVQLQTILKLDGKNSGQMWFKVEPDNLPLLSTLNWSALLTVSNPNLNVTSAHYDQDTGHVILDFDYTSTIEGNIDVVFDPTSEAKLAKVSSYAISKVGVASNNQALVYYEDSEYSLANVVKMMAIGASVVALSLFFIALLGGRLIGLQCLAVLQLSFLSLLTQQDVSPSFASLSYLSLSLGYNKLKEYDLSQPIDRSFKLISLNCDFIYNYNWMGLLPIVSLLIAIIMKLISKRSAEKESKSFYERLAGYAFGEYTLYLFLCFCSSAYASLFIQFKYMGSAGINPAGLCLGIAAVIFGTIYAVIYVKFKQYFLEFREKLRHQNNYYLVISVERVLSAALLVFFAEQKYGNIVILVIYAGLGFVVVKFRPYSGKYSNARPFANYLVVGLVSLILTANAFIGDPKSMIALYGPLIIVILLIVCIIYSAIYLILDLRKSFLKWRQEKELEKEGKPHQNEMQEFTLKLLQEQNKGILKSTSIYNMNETRGEDSPSLLKVSSIHERLNAFKLNQGQESPSRLKMSTVRESLNSLRINQTEEPINNNEASQLPVLSQFNEILELDEDCI